MFRNVFATLALLFVSVAPAAHAGEPAEKVVGAYYPGGSAHRYPVSRIPADRLTHLFYAFAQIEQGRCVAKGESANRFAELAALKRAHPRLRTVISIGGWTANGFSDAALTARSR